jgi:acyl carrier protein
VTQAVDHKALVREVAQKLELLEPDGHLRPLDSLSIIDLVIELEKEGNFEIPVSLLRDEMFASIEALAAVLDKVVESRPPSGDD